MRIKREKETGKKTKTISILVHHIYFLCAKRKSDRCSLSLWFRFFCECVCMCLRASAYLCVRFWLVKEKITCEISVHICLYTCESNAHSEKSQPMDSTSGRWYTLHMSLAAHIKPSKNRFKSECGFNFCSGCCCTSSSFSCFIWNGVEIRRSQVVMERNVDVDFWLTAYIAYEIVYTEQTHMHLIFSKCK